jgi:hypothetical protein
MVAAMEAAVATEPPGAATYQGGCHCGCVRWRMTTALAPEAIAPRACDCDFCLRHAAAWVSDALGRLQVQVRGAAMVRYRQGSGQAEFLLCGRCGVLVAVMARSGDGRWLGAANRNAFDERARFAAPTPVSPQQLGPDQKLARWSQLWTPMELAEA